MPRAHYTHQLISTIGRNCILVKDQGTGGMTVTNDVEMVIDEISRIEKIDAKGYMIVYADSNGQWDGWDATDTKFIILRCKSFEAAIMKYIGIQLMKEPAESFHAAETSDYEKDIARQY